MTSFEWANLIFAATVGLVAGMLFYLLQCAFTLTNRVLAVLVTRKPNGIHHRTAEGSNGSKSPRHRRVSHGLHRA
jgi:hypothetical protein